MSSKFAFPYSNFTRAIQLKSENKGLKACLQEWIIKDEGEVTNLQRKEMKAVDEKYYCVCGRIEPLLHWYKAVNLVNGKSVVLGSECCKHFDKKYIKSLDGEDNQYEFDYKKVGYDPKTKYWLDDDFVVEDDDDSVTNSEGSEYKQEDDEETSDDDYDNSNEYYKVNDKIKLTEHSKIKLLTEQAEKEALLEANNNVRQTRSSAVKNKKYENRKKSNQWIIEENERIIEMLEQNKTITSDDDDAPLTINPKKRKDSPLIVPKKPGVIMDSEEEDAGTAVLCNPAKTVPDESTHSSKYQYTQKKNTFMDLKEKESKYNENNNFKSGGFDGFDFDFTTAGAGTAVAGTAVPCNPALIVPCNSTTKIVGFQGTTVPANAKSVGGYTRHSLDNNNITEHSPLKTSIWHEHLSNDDFIIQLGIRGCDFLEAKRFGVNVLVTWAR